MAEFELAQLNVARMNAPLESPVMADFVAALDRINALADAAPGFLWRLKDDEGNATALRPFGTDMLVNMSVWRDVASLQSYVYKSDHVAIMRRRREWFTPMDGAGLVLWWVLAGHWPDPDEAAEKLAHLRRHGPTVAAFNFAAPFPPPA